MNELDLLKVLWVEDENLPYIEEAEQYDLYLCQYRCWDDAKKELEEKYDQYSAIILDAKCKFHVDSADNAVKFLGEALKDIASLAENKKRTIPWFVLTGGDASEVSDSINDDRLRWDNDWTISTNKVYYSKNIDREILFSRIKAIAKKSPRLQIQEIYKNVFDAIEECEIDNEGLNALEDLLIPIHFQNEIRESDFSNKFVQARMVLEYIFRSMSKHGLLPEFGKKVILQWSSLILCGKPALDANGETIIQSHKRILPEVLASLVKNMVVIIPIFCHSEDDSYEGKSKKDYLRYAESSTYLLKSFTMQLCDLILWYRNYLHEHKDIVENEANWSKRI